LMGRSILIAFSMNLMMRKANQNLTTATTLHSFPILGLAMMLAEEVNKLRIENEALKAQLRELNNGVLPEPNPDFSSLLLVPEPKPLGKQNRRKKRKDIIFVE